MVIARNGRPVARLTALPCPQRHGGLGRGIAMDTLDQPAGAAPNLDPSQRGEPLLTGRASAEVWLFGSLARGDWDARSDVDLLAVAPDQSAADQLADDLLGTGLADDVIALSQGRWLERQRGDDPWWRGICRDALRLQPLQRP